MKELKFYRQENSKTYDLGNGKRQIVASIGAIHYKDNYANSREQWKDIDLTIRDGKITTAPYELTVEGKKLTFRDKKTSEISTIELIDVKPEGLKFEIIPDNTRVRFQHILPSDNIPFEAKFKISGKGFVSKAFDDDGELKLETSIKDDILTERLTQVIDFATGIGREAKGKIRIDPTWQVGASTDDCILREGDGSWGIALTGNTIFAGYNFAGYLKYGAGMRFLNITIPAGSIITNAYLTLTCRIARSTTTVNSVIIGEKSATPATFSDTANYQARRGIIVGGANDDNITTASVAWNNIGAWTLDTEYNSPDIKTIIQEIIDLAGWVSGNNLALFWDDHAGNSTASDGTNRQGYSYDGSNAKAPKLIITYTTLGPHCYIAFTTDALADTPSWEDVTSYFKSYHFRKGRAYELDRMEAGTLEVELDNSDGHFWPDNVGGDYTPDVLPGKKIKITNVYGETEYPRFVGFIESWIPSWLSSTGGLGPIITVTAADGLKLFAKYLINDGSGYSQELSGTRVGNVADDIGWPAADRDLAAGQDSIIASGALSNVNSLTHLQDVQTTELGLLFIAFDGDLTYHDRHTRNASPYNSSVATFGDDVGELPYVDLKTELSDRHIYNEIRGQRDGGTEQTTSDATSIAAYGQRTLSRTGLLLGYDVLVAVYDEFLLARFKNAGLLVKEMTILPQSDPTNLMVHAMTNDISTRLTVRRNEASIDTEVFIEGIDESYKASEGLLKTTYQLSDADQQLTSPANAITITLRPTGAGTNTNCTASAGANWQCVDEATPNDDTDYVWDKSTPAVHKLDSYQTEDSAYTGLATISKVKVYTRCKCEANSAAQAKVKVAVYTNSTAYYGDETDLTTSYASYTKEWTTNPNTSAAWTWTQIQAMEIGVSLKAGITGGNTDAYARCTQVYAEVTFTPSW